MVVKQMSGDEKFYGLGDKTGVLNKRNYEYENWNSDLPQAHTDDFKALYKSIPFLITLKDAGVFGMFFDNTYSCLLYTSHCRSGFGYDAVCQFAYGKRSTDHIPEKGRGGYFRKSGR